MLARFARETGLSVRTLHHYDKIGLLAPSRRSEAGYRLYAASEIARIKRFTVVYGKFGSKSRMNGRWSNVGGQRLSPRVPRSDG